MSFKVLWPASNRKLASNELNSQPSPTCKVQGLRTSLCVFSLWARLRRRHTRPSRRISFFLADILSLLMAKSSARPTAGSGLNWDGFACFATSILLWPKRSFHWHRRSEGVGGDWAGIVRAAARSGKAGTLRTGCQTEWLTRSPGGLEGSQGPCQGSAYRPGLSVYTIASMRNKSPGQPPLNVRLMCSSVLPQQGYVVSNSEKNLYFLYLSGMH